jgi:hypothetical protein
VSDIPLYQRLMGDAWPRVAPAIRSMHGRQDSLHAQGRFRIDYGQLVLARILAPLLHLPMEGPSVDTTLDVFTRGDAERWLRTFDGHRLETRQSASDGSELVERFGVLELHFRLERSGESLVYVQRRAALVVGRLRVPLAEVLAPRVQAREDPAGASAIDVHVCVTLPAVGTLIAYDGTIEVEAMPS